MNVDLLCAGFCVVFGEASEDGRPADRREDYDWFAWFADSLPVWINHHPHLVGDRFHDVGRTVQFAVVNGEPPVPSGVLCLIELAANPIGRATLKAVNRGDFGALSLGGNGRPEVSLVNKPAFRSCRVIGTGAEALSAWDLLVSGVSWRRAARVTRLDDHHSNFGPPRSVLGVSENHGASADSPAERADS